MRIKQLFDCNKLFQYIITSAANNDDNEFKITEKYLFSFGQILNKASLATRNTVKSNKVCMYFQT